MTDNDISRQKNQAVSRAMAILQEHFEAVVILATHTMPDGRTGRVFRGSGNAYSQLGMADEFVREEMELFSCRGEE